MTLPPWIKVVRPLSPLERLRILRSDLAVKAEWVRQARRNGETLPAIALACAELQAEIEGLEKQLREETES